MESKSTPLLQLRGRSIWGAPEEKDVEESRVLRVSCLCKCPLPHLTVKEIGVKDWSQHTAIPCG